MISETQKHEHMVGSGEASTMTTEIYVDASEFGEYVIIRQGDDMVMIPATPGQAAAQAQAVAQILGVVAW